MKGENFNISALSPRVLVAPLDWGLGHATRCIPIIKELINNGCDVLVAAEGSIKRLLQDEFPGIVFLPLQGYKIQYSRNKFWLLWRLLFQFPTIMYRIVQEHRWLSKVIKQHAIDLVISDNRMGLHNASIPCVYITHQLNIKTGQRFTAWVAQKINYHYINKFTYCWIPDAAGALNLAGELSHPAKLPATPLVYIGPLSRFEKMPVEKKYALMIIISGPEPQRTIFEELLLNELRYYSESVLFVRGLPSNSTSQPIVNSNIEVRDHLTASAMNKAIEQSELIISRTGYTTIMDLVKLQRHAILIPTPGQTEQEYLAAYLMKKNICYSVKQTEFSLNEVIKKYSSLSYTTPDISLSAFKIVIKDFIAGLGKA